MRTKIVKVVNSAAHRCWRIGIILELCFENKVVRQNSILGSCSRLHVKTLENDVYRKVQGLHASKLEIYENVGRIKAG